MRLLPLTASLGLSTTAFAQSSQTTWSSIVFTLYGEKVPSLTDGPYSLTPLGANQSLNAGELIRQRYLTSSGNATELTTSAPINGLSVYEIDNSQIYALSTDDEFVISSALAFFQGLYPPRGVPVFDNESTLSDGSLISFPLDGYQYPNIGTVSTLDFNYIWISGNSDCTNYAIVQVEELESVAYSAQIASTQPFYDSLVSSVFSGYDSPLINYGNAWILYEYALYQYNHNRSKPISASDLDQLFNLASQQQFQLNTPNNYGTISSIAGQTLASLVLQQFSRSIDSSGVSDKLTLLFGSFEPMISFFALSSLSAGPSASLFTSLPDHGSSMVFELFSNDASNSAGQNFSTPFPNNDDLYVRFLFRNGTSDLDPLIEYPLFGRGNSEDDMSWTDFVTGMAGFSLNDVVDWCAMCDSSTLFCAAIEADTSNATTCSAAPPSRKTLSAAVGGVIGATVTLAVLILAAVILGLCGFRLGYHDKRANGAAVSEVGGIGVLKRSGSGKAGGFKGAEKLASDTDLRLKGGVGASVIRHERVGSWELSESPTSPRGTLGSLDKDVESGRMERVVSGADYSRRSEEMADEHVNPFGDPVKPVDQV